MSDDQVILPTFGPITGEPPGLCPVRRDPSPPTPAFSDKLGIFEKYNLYQF